MNQSEKPADSILETVLKNPALLSMLTSVAAKFSGGLLPFADQENREDKEEEVKKEEALAKESVAVSNDTVKKADQNGRGRMEKHKKLIEALMLYVDEDKRPRLVMVLKLLDLLEFAEGLGG